MDYDRCVGHHVSGSKKGQRCQAKGVYLVYTGSKLRVCRTHYTYYTVYSPRWIRQLVERAVLGRYNAPG